MQSNSGIMKKFMLNWRGRQSIYVYGGLIPYVAFALFPLYVMFVTSLKTKQEMNDPFANPFWVVQGITLENYTYLYEKTLFFSNWLFTTLQVCLLSTIIAIVFGTLAAYALARMKFRGVEAFGLAVFITYLVPPSLLFIPLIEVVNFLELRDSKWALVLTYPTFMVPFVTWLLMGYFRTVPREVEECAFIDGCGRLRTLVTIVVPMALPGLVCAILFAFTLSWNEFLYSLVFIQNQTEKTMAVGVFSELIRGDIYYWGSLMAATFTGTLPIIVVYAFFMDYYVAGLTAGAIK